MHRLRHRERRRAAIAVSLVMSFVAGSSTATTSAAPARVSSTSAVTAGADGGAPAVRGQRVQVLPLPPAPVYSGCLVGTVTQVSASVDPQRRWWYGTMWANWRSALAPVAGVRGPVVVVGDSLTLGSIDQTMRRLLDAGFGPVCIDGAVSRRMTVGTGGTVSSAVEVIGRVRASDTVWNSDVVRWVLAIGTNDARPTNRSTWATTIAAGRSAVGAVRSPVHLVDIRTRRDEFDPQWRAVEDEWNALLAGPGNVVVTWSTSVSTQPANYIIAQPDWVHLRPAGNDLRGAIIVAALMAT